MKKFIVNVNGNSYEVEVEEVGGTATNIPVATQNSVASQPVEAPAVAAPTHAAPKAQGATGAIKISAPMPGTILDVRVNAGDSIKEGDLVVVLEAMKMENEILCPQDATVATVNVTKGQQVNSGDLIVTLN